MVDLNKDKIIAIDTETYWDVDLCRNKAFIATTTDQQLNSELYELDNAIDRERLKKICEDRSIYKAFHNAPYDMSCLHPWGIKVVPPIEDTMIMATLVNENFSSKKLKDLAKNYLGEKCEENEHLKNEKKKICKQLGIKAADFQYNMFPNDVLYPYAKKDTEYTMKLTYYFRNAVKPFEDIYQMEMKLAFIVHQMQLNGIRINREFLVDRIIKFGRERNAEKDAAREEIAKLGITFIKKQGKKEIPVEFNPLSVHHMRKIWLALELPILKMTKGKNPNISVDKETVAELLENEEYTHLYNLKGIRHLARFKFLHKQLSTYAVPLYSHYTTENHNRASFMFWQSGAKTGRFSAELIQTMPRVDYDKGTEDIRMIRFAFDPEPGKVFAFVDYNQIEMRLFAHFSNSELLIKDINDGFDPHLGTTYNLFPKDLIDKNPIVKDTLRGMVKWLNFGIIYGLGRKALILKVKEMIYRVAHINPDLRTDFEAVLGDIDGVLRRYAEKYPVAAYNKSVISSLYKDGYVEINLNSPLMRVHRRYSTPKQMAYKAVNMQIQGCAAYVMKLGMLRATDLIAKKYQKTKLLLTAHDELVFEIPKKPGYIEQILDLQETMADKVTFKVPLIASIKVSEQSWGAARNLLVNGVCAKHGKLTMVDNYSVAYCDGCKKYYYVGHLKT